METRHLRAFVTVAEELHFRRAAVRLHTSQPALSQLIQTLERRLGVALFTRSTHHVGLTDAGRRLLPDAIAALAAIHRVDETVRALRDEGHGLLRIGVPANLPPALLPTVLRALEDDHPHARVSPSSMPSVRQVDALRRGDLDLGLVRELPDEPGVWDCRLVLREPLGVIAATGHPLAALTEVTARDLDGLRLYLWPLTMLPTLTRELLELLEGHATRPSAVIEAADHPTALAFAALGDGITLGHRRETGARHGLVWRPLTGAVLGTAVHALWHRGMPPPVAAAFVDLLIEHAGQLPA